MQITHSRKNMQMAYFTRKLNIRISHNGEMIKFLKFQGELLFSDFFHVLRDMIWAVFLGARQSATLSICKGWLNISVEVQFVACFPSEFQALVCLRNDRESNGEVC